MVRYLILSLLIISLFGCGEAEELSPLQTNIKTNGLLAHFPGGRLNIDLYPGNTTDGEALTCDDLLNEYSSVKPKLPQSELGLSFDIPASGDASFESTGNKITPGKGKVVYLQLLDSNGDLKGHACEPVVKCAYAHENNPKDSPNFDIKDGDKACVYLSIDLIQ